jgi:hypothetical protein
VVDPLFTTIVFVVEDCEATPMIEEPTVRPELHPSLLGYELTVVNSRNKKRPMR